MSSLVLPLITVAISLGLCFSRLVSTSNSSNGGRDKSSSMDIDSYMNNKNNGVNGSRYSETLSGCDFKYTGWK